MGLQVSLFTWYLHQESSPVGQMWCQAFSLKAAEQWYNTTPMDTLGEYTFSGQVDLIAML